MIAERFSLESENPSTMFASYLVTIAAGIISLTPSWAFFNSLQVALHTSDTMKEVGEFGTQ